MVIETLCFASHVISDIYNLVNYLSSVMVVSDDSLECRCGLEMRTNRIVLGKETGVRIKDIFEIKFCT